MSGTDRLLILGPILLPLLTAVAGLALWHRPRAQRFIGVAGTAALAAAAVALLTRVADGSILVLQVGGWAAPYGISLVVDLLSALMVLAVSVVALAVVVYSLVDIDKGRAAHGFYPLMQFLLMGACGALITGDLFNLYVWIELLLISSFVLLALGGERAQMEAAIKYVTLSLIGSVLLLAGVGLTYGIVGTLNMADLAVELARLERPGLVNAVSILFLLAMGLKAAVFPLFFWLPASYHTPPATVTALFSGILTKVGVYVLLRLFTLIFVQDVSYTHTIILVAAGLTMVSGVLGAVAQNEFRRILSIHIISQIGYMIMGLALMTPLALAGAIFITVHNIVVKCCLFLVSGLVNRLRGSYQLKKLGGVYLAHPVVAIGFFIPACSLAGVPPLSGFWAKFVLVRAGLEIGHYAIVATALVVGILTLFSMTKIWNEVFWKEAPEGARSEPLSPARWFCYLAPIGLLVVCTVAIGLFAGPLMELFEHAGRQLLDPTQYILAVLGERS